MERVGFHRQRSLVGNYISGLSEIVCFIVNMKRISQTLFREPDGRTKGLCFAGVSLGGALVWVSLSVTFGEFLSPFILFVSLSCGLLGVAESLPVSRRQLAGLMRVGAVSVQLAVLLHLTIVPDFYVS